MICLSSFVMINQAQGLMEFCAMECIQNGAQLNMFFEYMVGGLLA